MTRDRVLLELKKGEFLNVVAEAAQPIWDQQLIPVEIPIRRGIQGLRIFIVRQHNENLLNDISSIDQLARIPTGVGLQWSILPAMQQANFNLFKGSNYDGLFGMLAKDRFLTFNRGINEAYQELEQYKHIYPDLIVDSHILLHIPLATYYYVSPKYPEIAKRIKAGLLKLINEGLFNQFFLERICPDVALDLKQGTRKTFKIHNPQFNQPDPVVNDTFMFTQYEQVLNACKVKA